MLDHEKRDAKELYDKVAKTVDDTFDEGKAKVKEGYSWARKYWYVIGGAALAVAVVLYILL